jgi:hypothetical protein
MPIVILLLCAATFTNLIGKINVSWRLKIVAGDEHRRQGPETRFGNIGPGAACQEQGVKAHSAVGRGDALAGAAPPGGDDTVDRSRVDTRAVAEDDHRRLGLGAERREPALERGARSELPVRAVDDTRARLHVVRPEHGNDFVDGNAGADALHDRFQQNSLLR